MSSHWLATEIATLASSAGAAPAASPGDRRAFLIQVESIVRAAADRVGVGGVFASFDGMLVATAGDGDFDALAALAQRMLVPAADAWDARALGRIHQLLAVGERDKLALVCVGPIVLGVVSPADVRLSEAMA